jgi:hypothetical protein
MSFDGEGLAWRPVHRPATEQVKVQVINSLSGLWPLVHDEPVAIAIDLPLVGDPVRHLEKMNEHRCVSRLQVVDGRDVLFWNDEHMRRGNRTDVFEGDHLVVTEDLLRRDLSRKDLAEQAILGHRQSSLRAEKAVGVVAGGPNRRQRSQ